MPSALKMPRMRILLVRLKRHLRAHAPLFVIKPAWLTSAEFNASHLPFSPRGKLF